MAAAGSSAELSARGGVRGPRGGLPRPFRLPMSSACTPLFPGTSGVSGLPRFTSHVALLPPEALSPPFGPVCLFLSFQTAPCSRRRCLGPLRGSALPLRFPLQTRRGESQLAAWGPGRGASSYAGSTGRSPRDRVTMPFDLISESGPRTQTCAL